MQTRRTVVLASAAGSVGGCALLPSPSAQTGGAAPLLEGHCHLFNVKDLSAVRFIAYAILHAYPDMAEGPPAFLAFLGPDHPTWLDRFVAVVLAMMGADRAPSARTELLFLTGGAEQLASIDDEEILPRELDEEWSQVVGRATAFLGGASLSADHEAEDAFRAVLIDAGGGGLGVREVQALTARERRRIVERAILPDETQASLQGRPFYLPGLIDFIVQLKRFRHQITDRLATLHRRQGSEVGLMAPAMVDFGRWLVEDPEPTSDLASQVGVWAEISRRPKGPAIHGYVAFCPLRQVLHERTPEAQRTPESPLDLVTRALSTEGFLGVKLYPPMGFRAAGNAERALKEQWFSEEVLEQVFGHVPQAEVFARTRELGQMLDVALDQLFKLCASEQAPVLAHGGNSVGAGAETGKLADPYYWEPVFSSGGPTVLLAHFGGFAYVTADPALPKPPAGKPGDPPPFENTWEAWIACYIVSRPDAPVFADISMFTEILPGGDVARVEANFSRLRELCPTIADHLIFGTDWTMLAQAKGAGAYDGAVRAFLHRVFGVDAEGHDAVDKIMRRNFLRYAGLSHGSDAFERIKTVYRGDAGLTQRLRQACTL